MPEIERTSTTHNRRTVRKALRELSTRMNLCTVFFEPRIFDGQYYFSQIVVSTPLPKLEGLEGQRIPSDFWDAENGFGPESMSEQNRFKQNRLRQGHASDANLKRLHRYYGTANGILEARAPVVHEGIFVGYLLAISRDGTPFSDATINDLDRWLTRVRPEFAKNTSMLHLDSNAARALVVLDAGQRLVFATETALTWLEKERKAHVLKAIGEEKSVVGGRGIYRWPLGQYTAFEFRETRPLVYRRAEDISDTQLKILHLIGGGLTNREMAGVMDLSLSTIKYHLARIMRQFSVRNRRELVMKFRDNRMLGL